MAVCCGVLCGSMLWFAAWQYAAWQYAVWRWAVVSKAQELTRHELLSDLALLHCTVHKCVSLLRESYAMLWCDIAAQERVLASREL